MKPSETESQRMTPSALLAIVAGAVVLAYSLISNASILLAGILTAACWLYAAAVLREWSARRTETAIVAGVSALIVAYSLLSSSSVLQGLLLVVLLWIGLTLARIERHLRDSPE